MHRLSAYATTNAETHVLCKRAPSPDELTHRQREVAGLLCSTGLSYKEVAAKLDISEGTMRKHTENVYRRLGVHSRAELMIALSRAHGSNRLDQQIP